MVFWIRKLYFRLDRKFVNLCMKENNDLKVQLEEKVESMRLLQIDFDELKMKYDSTEASQDHTTDHPKPKEEGGVVTGMCQFVKTNAFQYRHRILSFQIVSFDFIFSWIFQDKNMLLKDEIDYMVTLS